jgi:NADH:ubiquinone oxidoreductase subunit E
LSTLSEAACRNIQALINKYPEKRSALIPSLHLAQKEVGYISPETVCEIARIFDLSPNEVQEVVSFYTMFHKKPVAEEIVAHLTKKLGIQPGETTADKKYTLLEVECLGSCGTSPVVQINDDYYEDLTPAKIDRILDSLK